MIKSSKFVLFICFIVLLCSVFCFSSFADTYEYTAPEYSPEYFDTIIGNGFPSKAVDGYYMYNSYNGNFEYWSFIGSYLENDVLFLSYSAINYDADVPYSCYVYFPNIERLVFDSFGGSIPSSVVLNSQDSFDRFYNYFYSTFVGGSSVTPPIEHYLYDQYFTGDSSSLFYVWNFIYDYIGQSHFDMFLMFYYSEFASEFDTIQHQYDVGFEQGQLEGFESGRLEGFSEGFSQGQLEGFTQGIEQSNGFINGITTIFNAPFYVVRQIFDFNLFGINIYQIILGVLTIVLIAFVIKLFL